MSLANVLILALIAACGGIAWRIFFSIRDRRCFKHTGKVPPRPAILGRLMWGLVSLGALGLSYFGGGDPFRIGLLTSIAVTGWMAWRFDYWVSEGRHMQTSGHLAPPPSVFARLFWWVITPVLAFLSVGPVTIIGRHRLKKAKGRRVYAPNHHFQMDFNMVSTAVRRHFRYMTAASELKGFSGIFGAWTGSIPVNTKVEGGGEAALNASIECMVDNPDGSFLIFPQGKLLPLDEIKREDFRTGAARLTTAIHEETEGEPAWIIPMGLFYKSDKDSAGFWGRLLAPVRKAVFGTVKYGCVVVIGEPIAASDLPADAKVATDLLHVRISALVKEAAAHAAGVASDKQ